MVRVNLDNHKLKNEIRTLPKTTHKAKFKMDERPKLQARYYKLLRENTGRTLFGINHSEILFDPPTGAMEIKTKINN